MAWTAPIIPNPPAQYDQRIFEQRDRALNSALVLLARILPLLGSGSSGGGGTPSGDYVSSFNGRLGNVFLSSADVTGALSFTPAPSTHNHTGVYAPAVHTHAGVYAPVGHSHAILDTTGLQAALDAKAESTHNHSGVYAEVVHTHSADDISNATAAGKALLTSANATAQRTALELTPLATATVGSGLALVNGVLSATAQGGGGGGSYFPSGW
jgi:hypothetical protein